MGIGSNQLRLLLQLRREGHLPLAGAVAEIGAQQLSTSFFGLQDELRAAEALFKTGSPAPQFGAKPTAARFSAAGEVLDASAPLARSFWHWLRYRYLAIDVDESPDSLPLDLNYDQTPDDARGRFDLVTNFGTTEHVANQLHAFKLIHELTKAGGVMMHHLPMQGNLTHGLVNYNPKFFWMLARSNDYQFLHMSFTNDGSGPPHQDFLDFILKFIPELSEQEQNCQFTNAYITVVLKKIHDLSYVPPLDVPTGAAASNETFKERYWGVFAPERFTKRR